MNYPSFSIDVRKEKINALASGDAAEYDAVIVGGGIVGAGLARELAIRGIKSLLVEKGDFASGTSSRSSKLIHGGLRYLEMFDFGLVFESLAERYWLLKTHPHLVQPLQFNLPIFSKDQAPAGARSSALLGAGLWLYDALSLFRTPFFHGRYDSEDMRRLFPNIREKGLGGGYFYSDAMMMDDEIVLETLLDAYRRGATPLNYVQALEVGAKNSSGKHEISLQDTLVENGQRFSVRTKQVIVCVGPWTQEFGGHVVEGPERKLKPSKGVHLILPWSRFPIERCLVMYSPDGRIIFAIPRKDLGVGAEKVIIGTTDSPAGREPLEKLSASPDDVSYLLKVVSEYFPQARISSDDIVMTYAGVRPLLDDGEKSEAKTSREHEIWRNKAGVVFMAGGKYTTFRKISQEIADFTFPKTRSRDEESKSLLSSPEDYEKRLLGKRVWGKFTDEWVRWKLEHHMPCTLEDIVFRRLPLWMEGAAIKEETIDTIAALAQKRLGWNAAELQRQKDLVKTSVQRGLNWRG